MLARDQQQSAYKQTNSHSHTHTRTEQRALLGYNITKQNKTKKDSRIIIRDQICYIL